MEQKGRCLVLISGGVVRLTDRLHRLANDVEDGRCERAEPSDESARSVDRSKRREIIAYVAGKGKLLDEIGSVDSLGLELLAITALCGLICRVVF